ncbi:carboxymuconolactone decarboxylase family protein [Micromonospora cathayae]|uniref:Carboxymuconolactone decarboxylase family protein n=1 Tax=Micromonospora cathayae TaxID=3028804 RepID=A0ABY7ZK28_9ACTN|nr:carboxymuconolactone decarboxylase family protein [Micromonospora sp. HUAS 3]WDZ83316.1 carboxymuconolactone decarboxylase family protein [Micromonospora sp. HUAS 3]
MLASRVVSSVVQRQVKYVTPVPPADAGGVVADVYAQAAEEMRLVTPPLLLHSPAPEALAAYWMLMREPLMTGGAVDRMAKEAVAAAVSVSTICPYCVDMHSAGMYADADADDAEAIVADRVENVADPRIRALAGWARNAHLPDAPVDLTLTAAERAELVGVVVSFHYLTRMVNVFLSSFLVPPRLTPAARRRVKHGIGRLLGRTLRESHPAGRSVSLLPPAELPADAGWAVGNEAVAQATARAYAALEAAGERALSPEVRAVVRRRLGRWRGEETGLSRQWCEDLVDHLSEPDRAAGRLALLTAFASYQVDEEVVAEFRRHHPGDRQLVEAVGWASLVAARQVGALHLPTDPRPAATPPAPHPAGG